MIRADQIPNEVVEAAARAEYETMRAEAISDLGAIAGVMHCPWDELSQDAKEYHMGLARAAIAAALSAWPSGEVLVGYCQDRIVLPLPQKDGDA